ncbi:hypothetical protein [Pseudaestuariivita atlantica]|uniref:hypothetical protein n=1 Tax=Pseudaestuariivita atlantica TaxID=1317121 RepID=UPI00067ABA6C|nr:hypothetical protein [Pseudaestuariivita atlantica]
MKQMTQTTGPGDGLPFRVSLEAVNKGVGLVALGLPFVLLAVTWLGNTCPDIDSISHYYYSRLGGDILVGSLCFIGVLLLFFYRAPVAVDGYLGHHPRDIWLARLAGLAAFGVALVPTAGSGCEDFAGNTVRLFLTGAAGKDGLDLPAAREIILSADPDKIADLVAALEPARVGFDFWSTLGISGGMLTFIHYGSALVMFLVLAYFAYVVFPRPQTVAAQARAHQDDPRKRRRNLLYKTCGILILVAIGALGAKFLFLGEDSPALATWNRYDLTFWFEALGLVAFGVSWSIKGRIFEFLRDTDEPMQSRKGYQVFRTA